jgi:hypothetical protein
MTTDIVSERRKQLEYEGQILATIPEIAKAMDMSCSRIRFLLTEPEAPKPVHKGEHIFKGRISSLYDQKEVILYFLKAKKQLVRKYIYLRDFIKRGILNEGDFQV